MFLIQPLGSSSAAYLKGLSTKFRAIRLVKTCSITFGAHPIRAMPASETDKAKTRDQNMATTASPSFESIRIKNTKVNEASGVNLSPHQKLLVGSILDLFEGNPTLKHLSLWSRNGTFTDPITIASGYDKFAAQWYGLPALFSPIQIQSHSVTSAGNPIEMNLSNKYILKGIKTGQTIDSVVRIFIGQDNKIERVEDRWNNKLPEGVVSEAFRKLNAITVPSFVTVPKTEEEDLKLEAERGNAS